MEHRCQAISWKRIPALWSCLRVPAVPSGNTRRKKHQLPQSTKQIICVPCLPLGRTRPFARHHEILRSFICLLYLFHFGIAAYTRIVQPAPSHDVVSVCLHGVAFLKMQYLACSRHLKIYHYVSEESSLQFTEVSQLQEIAIQMLGCLPKAFPVKNISKRSRRKKHILSTRCCDSLPLFQQGLLYSPGLCSTSLMLISDLTFSQLSAGMGFQFYCLISPGVHLSKCPP